jgi:hypothetical protein
MADDVTIITGKRAVGIKVLESAQRAFISRIDDKLCEIKEDVSNAKIERMAWDILGQVSLYDRKKQLEKELAQVESKMSDFDGGKCASRNNYTYGYNGRKENTQIEDARAAAHETLYPQVKQLEKLKKELNFKMATCVVPAEFKDVATWLETELKKII